MCVDVLLLYATSPKYLSTLVVTIYSVASTVIFTRKVIMRATEAERERELETAITLREREIEELEEQKRILQSQMVVATPALRSDPLLASYPALDYCGRKPRLSIRSIPIEQVGNTLSQLSIAERAIKQQNSKDSREIKNLRRLLREQEKRCSNWTAKAQALSDESGIDLKCISEKDLNALSVDDAGNGNIIEETNARRLVVLKEIKAGEVIRHKKGNVIKALTDDIENCGIIDTIDEIYNQIRVVDRDISVEMTAIARRTLEVEEVDACLEEKALATESASRMLMEQDVLDLRAEKEEMVNSQRIPQERVVKAQDYRLSQLESRLKAVDKALSSNHLTRDVQKIIANNWAYNTIDVSENREDLYDIERIIPAQEKIHPGLYNLFLTEKEKSTRTVSVLNIVTKEKEEVKAALTCKLEAKCREYTMLIQQLDELASSANYAEEEQRKQALLWVREHRAYYNRLLAEKQQLRCPMNCK